MANPNQLELQRKRFFFSICATMTMISFIFFSVLDILEGDLVEALIDLVVIALMFASLAIMKIFRSDLSGYRITHFLISLLVFYSVHIGAGQGTVIYWLFMVPLLFFFFFGKGEGMIWTLFFSLGLYVFLLIPDLFNGHVYSHFIVSRFSIAFFFVVVVGYGQESTRHRFSKLLNEKKQALQKEKRELENAMENIKTLTGLLPICATCKKIRDDQGYWNQLETYLSEHSGVSFSHGICPECQKKLPF